MTTGRAIRAPHSPGVEVAGWHLFRILQRITKFATGQPKVEDFHLNVVAADVVQARDVAEFLARRAGGQVVDHRGSLDFGSIDALSVQAAQDAARLTRPFPDGPRVIT